MEDGWWDWRGGGEPLFITPRDVYDPDDDELMYQYDNEIDEYTAEESWS